jgi:hypothetical protein
MLPWARIITQLATCLALVLFQKRQLPKPSNGQCKRMLKFGPRKLAQNKQVCILMITKI